MINTKSEIAVTNSSPGVTLTLENTGTFFGIIVSVSILSGVAISIITKMNRISFSVDEIQESLKELASNAEKIKDIDKRLDIHLQDYVNYKDANLLSHNGLEEQIKHKWERSEGEFNGIKGSIKELQGFLHRHNDFKIRE